MEENEAYLKRLLKKKRNKPKYDEKTPYDEEFESEKPQIKGFWDVVCNISKALLNKVLNFFGVNFLTI